MQIEYIKEFMTLANNMSFSETAQLLYTTSSTLSRHIASIEEEIDAKLLIRDTHHVRLTEEGKVFLQGAQEIVDQYDQTLLNIRLMKSKSKTSLRIGYLPDATSKYINKLKHAIDKVDANIFPKYFAYEYGELMNNLVNKRIDIALTVDIDQRIRKEVRCIKLDTDRYCAIFPKNHSLAGMESVSLDQIRAYSFIYPDPDVMGATYSFFTHTLESNGEQPTVASYYEDIPSLFVQVQTGEGVSLALEHHGNRYSDVVSFVPLTDDVDSCAICIMWLQTNTRVPDALGDELARMTGNRH